MYFIIVIKKHNCLWFVVTYIHRYMYMGKILHIHGWDITNLEKVKNGGDMPLVVPVGFVSLFYKIIINSHAIKKIIHRESVYSLPSFCQQ